MTNPFPNSFQHETIGCYRPGKFYSESLSGLPYEAGINLFLGVGRSDSFNPENPYCKNPGGPEATQRLQVFLHETAHFIHDLSLGSCMDLDYLNDGALAALLKILQQLPEQDTCRCPLLANPVKERLTNVKEIASLLELLEQRESMARDLLSGRDTLYDYAVNTNPIFTDFTDEISQLSGVALLEGLVATKTLIAVTLRIRNEEDAKYLDNLKNDLKLLPENLPEIYNYARRLYDHTVGALLGIKTKYQGDSWPLDYSTSSRLISDEGFLYLADIALHVPPFEYIEDRVQRGLNQRDDFIPVFRFIRAIDVMLKKGGFPPRDDPSAPSQFYKTVFDFVASALDWPTFQETNYAWLSKIDAYKKLRNEAADGYRLRMVIEKHQQPSDMVVKDGIGACVGQMVPIFHLTPTSFKILSGMPVKGNIPFVTPFEMGEMTPLSLMGMKFPPWTDGTADSTIDDVQAQIENQHLFQQEVIYRSIGFELKAAILYGDHFRCPFSKQGCEIASESCRSITNLDSIPNEGCCIRLFAEQRQLAPSRIYWSL